MPLNPSGAISLAGPVAGQSIAVELGVSATATISLNDTNVRTLAEKPSGIIVMPTDFYGKSPSAPGYQRGIFGFGQSFSPVFIQNISTMNLTSNTGVIASDTPSVATGRQNLAAATYGGDKGIFGFGNINVTPAQNPQNMNNLVSNTGVVASDTPSSAQARFRLAAAGYGGDKAIFGFGMTPAQSSITNLVSNTGVVAGNTPGVGTSRRDLTAVSYGGDRAMFAYGFIPSPVRVQNIINLVSNTGVVAANAPTVGTARRYLAAASYGGDKGIMAFGANPSIPSPTLTNITNLVSNTGVVASDTPGVGTAKENLAAATYGGNKAIFSFGSVYTTNLVSDTGIMASDTPGVGTYRNEMAATSFSLTA